MVCTQEGRFYSGAHRRGDFIVAYSGEAVTGCAGFDVILSEKDKSRSNRLRPIDVAQE